MKTFAVVVSVSCVSAFSGMPAAAPPAPGSVSFRASIQTRGGGGTGGDFSFLATAGCEDNNEGITRVYGANTYKGVKYTLQSCQAKCRGMDGCAGIDYFEQTGWCNIFGPTMCSNPMTFNATSYVYSPALDVVLVEEIPSRTWRLEGQTCGWVYPMGDVGECGFGMECKCVGDCADPMMADAPNTCVPNTGSVVVRGGGGTACGVNEVYATCRSSSCWEATCRKPVMVPYCLTDCNSGCHCRDGFVRNEATGACVRVAQCNIGAGSCNFNNEVVRNGQSFTSSTGKTCTCRNGRFADCTVIPGQNPCQPSITTCRACSNNPQCEWVTNTEGVQFCSHAIDLAFIQGPPMYTPCAVDPTPPSYGCSSFKTCGSCSSNNCIWSIPVGAASISGTCVSTDRDCDIGIHMNTRGGSTVYAASPVPMNQCIKAQSACNNANVAGVLLLGRGEQCFPASPELGACKDGCSCERTNFGFACTGWC